MDIRLATINDIKDIVILRQKTWNETYRGIYPDELIDNFDYQKEEEKFVSLINDNEVKVYVLCDNNNIVGLMTIGKPYHSYLDYEQELGMLYILKEYQGQGYGKKLFILATDTVKESGYQRMLISCNKYNKNALLFYEKMGCIIIHEDKDNDSNKRYVQVKFCFNIR